MNTIKNFYKILPLSLWAPIYRLIKFSALKKLMFKKLNVGIGSYIDPNVQIIGWKNVKIGSYTNISENTWINVNFRDDTTPRVVVGNNCHIGRNNFFSSGPIIEIKDYGFTGLDCRFLGCGHDIYTPLVPYVASGLSEGAIIEIGVNCWLSTAVTVMQNVRIGCGTVVGAGSLVTNDLPSFCIAVGNPCKVIKRYDFKNNKWIKISKWTPELNEFLPSEDEYLSGLKINYLNTQPALLARSSRFGWL